MQLPNQAGDVFEAIPQRLPASVGIETNEARQIGMQVQGVGDLVGEQVTFSRKSIAAAVKDR